MPLLLLLLPQAPGPRFWQSQLPPLAVQRREGAEGGALGSRTAPCGTGFRACHWHGHPGAVDGAAAGSATCPRHVQSTRGALLALWRLPALARDGVACAEGGDQYGSVHWRLAQMRQRAAEQRQVVSRTGGPCALSQFVWQVEVPMAPLSPQGLDDDIAEVFKGMKPLDCKSHSIAWQNLSLMRLLGAGPDRLKTLLRKVDFLCRRNDLGAQFVGRVQLYRLYGCDIDCLLVGACKAPKILLKPTKQVSSILQFLKDEIGVQDMSRPLRQFPTLLYCRVAALRMKVARLEKIGLTVDGQLIQSHSELLTRSSVSLEDSAQALLEMFGEDSSKVIRKHPMALRIRRESLVQRLEVLASLLGDKEARTAVAARPTILLARQETMKESYNEIQERFGRNDALSLVHRYPKLLGQSWKSMGPKWNYLVEEVGVDKSQILAHPQSLGCSLENRIRPRCERMRSMGRLNVLGLGTFLAPTDEEFDRRYPNDSTEVARLKPVVEVADFEDDEDDEAHGDAVQVE